ncbi:hypothetical protein HPB49_020982 [Dermacentor silvarum]|uniref:Uncharacterized protein n=5 Tax=Dermacentor silvarum TaxID=543639 RepID=A0ACB8CZV7_DERSI|nr:hypothetical protein HPB49_020982 [Dermacentor silvarum]
MQDRLQRAIREVERHLEDMGLVCSPDKLEILLHRPRKKGLLPQGVLDAHRLGICITTREGTRIPTVSCGWKRTVPTASWLPDCRKVAAATHVVRRVANKTKGMKERNVTRLIQAFTSAPKLDLVTNFSEQVTSRGAYHIQCACFNHVGTDACAAPTAALSGFHAYSYRPTLGNDIDFPLGSAASTPQHVRASRGRDTSTHDTGVPNPTVVQKHRRRNRCKRKASTINVGFLNLHGARKAAKWGELYTALKSESITLYAVAETHLRNLEEPPIDLEWHWAGCNRTDECRKGGGVGVLWRNTTTWVPMTGSCDEHMWVSGSILDIPVLVGVVYLAVASGQHDGNDRVIHCIIQDVKRWATEREVLLMGDFNGHIHPSDGYQDHNGKILLRCAEELSLEIVNLRADCKGEFTWCARGSRSTIDYALVSAKLAARITQVHIDEAGQFSLGSDHNRIRLSFSASAHQASCVRPQRRPGLYLPNRSVEQVAEDFEQCSKRREAQSYDEFVHALRSVMHEHMVRDRLDAHKPCNPWWDKEVEMAWRARRQANREHRRTVKGLDAEACAAAWALYLEVKHKVQILVQNKIADHNLRLVQSIRMEGKSAAGKFWTYVRVFGPPNMDDDCRQCDETTAPPAPSSTEGTMCQDGPCWALSRLTVDRALTRISARTAPGPDDMPARLIKCIGANSREQLAKLLTAVMDGEPVPEDWHKGKVTLILKRGGDASSAVSKEIAVTKGLRQGCPLSPLLYILYTSRMERALLNSGLGFRLRFSTSSANENHRLPGLAFADDLVIMAENREDLQTLLDICQVEISRIGLCFSTRKSAVVCLAGGLTDPAVLTLGGKPVAICNEYRYLGVTLCAEADKYSFHETALRQAALRAQRILRRRCLWGCNRFLMIRDLWKLVHVPGLTFANAVTCLSPATREWLERQQREAGRTALGCHGHVANEAVQGDVGWSSFEAREAASKIAYRGRLLFLPRTQWARRVFEYLSATCMRTDWTRRVYHIEKKYGFFGEKIEADTAAKWSIEVRRRVKEAETTIWSKEMESKSTLELYRGNKRGISAECFYDNSIGSSLLFEARAGALRTLVYRSRFQDTGMCTKCRLCGAEAETQEHLILRCAGLQTAPAEDTDLPRALGFHLLEAEDGNHIANGRNVGRTCAVVATKKRLTEWWTSVRRM